MQQGSSIGGQAQLEAQLQQLLKLGMKASVILVIFQRNLTIARENPYIRHYCDDFIF